MSEKKIRDFAKTKHSGIPHKVDEAITNPTPEKRSPRTTRTQKETARVRVLQKLLGLARLREDLQPTTSAQIAAHKKLAAAEQGVINADKKAIEKRQKMKTQIQTETNPTLK